MDFGIESPEPEDGFATPIGIRRDAVLCDPPLPGFLFFLATDIADFVGGGGGLGGDGGAGMSGLPPPKHIGFTPIHFEIYIVLQDDEPQRSYQLRSRSHGQSYPP